VKSRGLSVSSTLTPFFEPKLLSCLHFTWLQDTSSGIDGGNFPQLSFGPYFLTATSCFLPQARSCRSIVCRSGGAFSGLLPHAKAPSICGVSVGPLAAAGDGANVSRANSGNRNAFCTVWFSSSTHGTSNTRLIGPPIRRSDVLSVTQWCAGYRDIRHSNLVSKPASYALRNCRHYCSC